MQRFVVAVTRYPSSRKFFLAMLSQCSEGLSSAPHSDQITRDVRNLVDLFIVKGFKSVLEFT